MSVQTCPVCFCVNDVSIYVSGQKAQCVKCRNRFVVERSADGARGPSLDGTPAPAGAVPVEPGPPRRRTPAAGATPPTRVERAPEKGPVPATPAAIPSPRAEPAPPAPAPEPPPRPPEPPRAAAPSPDPRQDPAANPNKPPVITGYEMLKLIGQGAMGTVWKARRESVQDIVAIKILVEHLAKSPDFIWRFEREAAAMAAVRHKGVVSLLERGSYGGMHYLVMEFVDGEPIRREMERTRMPPLRAVAICRRVARGLNAAHMAGIVHRDLKPENVLLSSGGELKIVDFGLAGLAAEVDPHPNLTRSRVTMGTMNYMAPEQRVDAKRVDRRADIYSLGVILYEMFTRDLPLGRFTLPHERGVAVPPLADEILRRALAQEARSRYATAAEMDADMAELERQIQGGTHTDPATGRKRWWPFA